MGEIYQSYVPPQQDMNRKALQQQIAQQLMGITPPASARLGQMGQVDSLWLQQQRLAQNHPGAQGGQGAMPPPQTGMPPQGPGMPPQQPMPSMPPPQTGMPPVGMGGPSGADMAGGPMQMQMPVGLAQWQQRQQQMPDQYRASPFIASMNNMYGNNGGAY